MSCQERHDYLNDIISSLNILLPIRVDYLKEFVII